MAINLQSLSLTSAFNSIVNFFRSQANNNKWKDLTSGAEGSFLIRLLANIFSTLSYRIVAQAREVFLSTAALRSSNIGISVNLGYSTFRGSNLKRRINIRPTGNFTLPKLSMIGSYDSDHDIYVLGKYNSDTNEYEDVTLVEGEAQDIDVVVGKIKEETFVTGTSATKCFSLFTSGISEDYTLYLDSVEVPTTKVIKEMTEDKYLVRTNPYSSVDIMYLNNYSGFKYTYGTGSEITIRYIELEDVTPIPFTDSMFVNYGVLLNTTTISTYLAPESIDQIKVNAPLDHETQNLIRSKQDYANRLNEIIPSIVDANYKPLTYTYTVMTGLKNDFTLLTEDEVDKIKGLLREERFFGTPIADLLHPKREVANLKISLALNNKYKNIADINLDIDNILKDSYDAVLGTTFNTYELERKIESLSYVKYARVSHVINDRLPTKNYQVGYILEKADETGKSQYYIASKILGMSGITVPDWQLPVTPTPDVDTGLITKDGGLYWRAYKLLPNILTTDLFTWQPSKPYGVGDYVTDYRAPNYMFKCVDLVKSSGFEAPDITYAEVGEFVVDGEIVWVTKDRSNDYDTWLSSTNYRLGQSVNVPSNSNLSLECVSYTGTAGTDDEVSFELSKYDVIGEGDVELSSGEMGGYFTVAGNKEDYFRKDDIITATDKKGSATFAVVESNYSSETGLTTITVSKPVGSGATYDTLYTQERGTRDGYLLWTLVEDIDNITYPWNSYSVFEHELEIIE